MGDNDKPATQGGSWPEWARHVLLELNRHDEEFKTLFALLGKQRADLESLNIVGKDKLRKDIAELRNNFNTLNVEMAKELTTLKMKAGVWGLLGALIPLLIALATAALAAAIKLKVGG